MAAPKQPIGIGANVLEINAEQFIRGMGTSDYTPDGGFGSSTVGINPLITPGVIYSTGAQTDLSTNVAGNLIASCEDSQAIGAAARLFVDDVANYYTLSGGTLTKSNTGTATTHYAFGKTDMASVAQQTYVSLDNDIARWNTSTNTLTENWWTGTVTTNGSSHPGGLDNTVPHPLLNFANPVNPGTALWIGNGNVLNFYDPVGDRATVAQLTFGTSERIYALGIDPTTGLMLISTQQTVNISDTLSSRYFVYLHDGFSANPRRKIPVSDLVTAFYNVGGIAFAGFGNKLGYWNGSGISFLRTLANVSFSQFDLPYKHHFAAAGNTLLVADGSNILAYGEISQGGSKAFYYPYQNPSNSNHLNLIAPIGSMQVGISYATQKFVTINLAANAAGSATLYTSNINFPRPVYIRKMRIITTGITLTSAFGIGDVFAFDESGKSYSAATPTFVNPVSGSTKYVFDFFLGDPKVHTFQPRISIGGQAFGITRIIIFYDIAE